MKRIRLLPLLCLCVLLLSACGGQPELQADVQRLAAAQLGKLNENVVLARY